MEYKLIGNNNYADPLNTVLTNRGIEDIETFLKAGNNPKSEIHYSKLDNIDKAVDCILKHVKGSSKVFFQVDPDLDGYLSSAMAIRYLLEINPDLDIVWRNQEDKQHGIKASDVPSDVDLVVVIDAGSNDVKEHKKLHERGIDVLVIDHHIVEEEVNPKYVIIVNNQLGDYKNRDLSGTGVIYKVLQALDVKLNVNYADEYLDLVGIGIVGDMMDLRSKENRYYVTQGLNNIKNPMIKQLFKEQEYSTKGIQSPMTVSFYIAPLFNAVIRAGTKEEKNQMFESLLSDGSEQVYYERGKTDESLITNTIRMMRRVRQQQNKIVDESVEQIEQRIVEKDLLDNKILIVEVTGMLDKSFTGLTANRLLNSNHIKRPVLLLRYDEEKDTLSGSARGYDKGYVKDFRQFLNDSGYFEYNRGHANAFGSSIKREKLLEFNDTVNEKYEGIDFGSSMYDVDFILKGNNVSKGLVDTIDRHHFLWGMGVEVPLIAVEGIEIERRNLHLIGAHKNHLKFSYGGTEYIKFFIEDEERDLLMNGDSTKTLVINLVGKASINEFRGRRNSQIIIEDFAVIEEKSKTLAF